MPVVRRRPGERVKSPLTERWPTRATNDYPVVEDITVAEDPYWIASFRIRWRFTKFPALDSADTWS
jgi:hypothetical protein